MKSVLLMTTLLCFALSGIVATCQASQPDPNFALLRAAFEGDLARVRENLAKGASVNYRCTSLTPLIVASFNGHLGVVKELLDRGADVNLRAKDAPTALMEASALGHAELVELLLEKGAEVNATASFVWTEIRMRGDSCADLKEAGAAEELCVAKECCMTALCVAADPKVRAILKARGGHE